MFNRAPPFSLKQEDVVTEMFMKIGNRIVVIYHISYKLIEKRDVQIVYGTRYADSEEDP